jgi:hypothetical protein
LAQTIVSPTLNGLIGFDGAGVAGSWCQTLNGSQISGYIALAISILSPTLNGLIGFDGAGVA